MDKNEIFTKLKHFHKSLRVPSNIEFHSGEGILTITMSREGLISNMQKNPAAFEGWAFSIKAAIPEIAEKVVIKWGSNLINSNPHYTRFLYRVIKFVKSYSWANYECLDDQAKADIEHIKSELNDWVINYPSQEAQDNAEHEEAQLERQLNAILPGHHNHQLPVGLFFQEVASKQERTPRGGSQIDLWSIEKDIFTVYELKKEDNRQVGIVSELMFYVNVIKDLVSGQINFGKGSELITERNYDKVYYSITQKKITKVIGVFLANDLHPILKINTRDFFKILNDNERGIEYKQKKFVITKIIDAQ